VRFLASLLIVAVTIGAGFTWLYPPGSSDRVTTAEREARQDSFTRLEPIQLEAIDQTERVAATDAMQLPPSDRAALRAFLAVADTQAADTPANNQVTPAPVTTTAPDVSKQPIVLTRLTLWDTHAEDGDVVAIVSAGYRREVRITNGVQRVIIPVKQGTSVIEVIGIHDGGGGITLGVEAAGGQALMPIMAVGQTLALPVTM
jgi:hypothetical protein